MNAIVDRTGQVVGSYTVISRGPDVGSRKRASWLCRCRCGDEKVASAQSLRRGEIKACKQCQAAELIGQSSGFLTCVSMAADRRHGAANATARYLLVRCACGTEKELALTSFVNGMTKSCGCYHREVGKQKAEILNGELEDLTGKLFGRWMVVSRVDGTHWNCKCSCGTIKSVDASNLKRNSKSCGCLQRELMKGNKYGSRAKP